MTDISRKIVREAKNKVVGTKGRYENYKIFGPGIKGKKK